MSYSDSGGTTESHIDVNVTSKVEFLYYREENWCCKNCDEENSEDRTNCWNCKTKREFD